MPDPASPPVHQDDRPSVSLIPPERNGGFLPVLRNRDFMLVWAAQGISQIAYNAVNFALVVVVETITRSSVAVSLIILAFTLPAILFSAVAGVLVDRSRKRDVMFVTTALRTLVLASLMFVDLNLPLPILLGWLYLATFFFSTLSQVFGPAEGALIPRLVGKRLLIPANALFNLTFFASQLLGLAVVGPILAGLFGFRVVFQAATALYALCALLLWLLPREPRPERLQVLQSRQIVSAMLHDMAEGVRVIWRDPLLKKAIGYLSLASTAFLMLAVLGPGFVTRVLELEANDLGAILAPAGFGILLGIVLVNRFATPANRERMIDLGVLTAGLAILALTLTKPVADALTELAPLEIPLAVVLAVIVIASAVLGVSNAYIIVPSQTVLQERSEDAMRARIYAAFYTVSSAISLGPILFAAALADLVGVVPVLALIGVALGGIATLSIRRRATT